MLQCCVRLHVVCLYGMYTVAKRCVLEQKLLLTAYMKSYMRNRLYQNERPMFKGRIQVTGSKLNISETDIEIEAWVIQRTANIKWHMEYQMVTWPMTSLDPKVLWGSTVGYHSNSLASCYVYQRRRALYAIYTTGYSLIRVLTDVHRHFSVITSVWDWRFLKNIEIA